ncbi:hypothetical protein SAMN05421868_13474 [Paenibacillus naphthalenovorans]|nr:hypothetical protein SAMN05421868_13474 [Paenibacillus naphthalenovorans]
MEQRDQKGQEIFDEIQSITNEHPETFMQDVMNIILRYYDSCPSSDLSAT